MNLRPRRAEPPRVDITPLIFFMVSTTFDKETQLKVDLPEAASSETTEQEEEKIEITIDAKGNYYVNERELVKHDAATLHRTLQKIADGRGDLPVIVSGDSSAPWQSMMTVLDVAAQLGLSRLSFLAKQSEPETD